MGAVEHSSNRDTLDIGRLDAETNDAAGEDIYRRHGGAVIGAAYDQRNAEKQRGCQGIHADHANEGNDERGKRPQVAHSIRS